MLINRYFIFGFIFLFLLFLLSACLLGDDIEKIRERARGTRGEDIVIDAPVVSGITLRWALETAGNLNVNKPEFLKSDDVRIFSAVVTGIGNFNTDYNISITCDDKLTEFITIEFIGASGAVIVSIFDLDDFDDIEGKITVQATSVGLNSAGIPEVSAEWVIDVIDDLKPLNFSDATWVIKNTRSNSSVPLNSQTTTQSTLIPTSDKRYKVFNNEPGALIDQNEQLIATGTGADSSQPNAFKDVTIMYLNKAFVYDPDISGEFGIEARIRISRYRDDPLYGQNPGEAWSASRQGIVMAAIENPENINPRFNANGFSIDNDAPWFVGLRTTAAGQRRGYHRRGGSGEYGSVQFPTTDSENIPGTSINARIAFGGDDVYEYIDGSLNPNLAKIEAFHDQEYIFKLIRTGISTWTATVLTADGLNVLVKPTAMWTGTNALGSALLSSAPVYLGFLVYGVEAEISDIRIYYNGQVAWTDSAVASANPRPVEAKRIDIVNDVSDNTAFYSIRDGYFAPFTLTGNVIPLTYANRAVTWSVVSGSSVNIDSSGYVTRNGSNIGTTIVRATAVGAPSVIRDYSIEITSDGNANENIIYEWTAGNAVTFTGPFNVVNVRNAPWYYILGGNATDTIEVNTSGIWLKGPSGVRLVIGTYGTNESNVNNAPAGMFDFSKGAKVTINYIGARWNTGNFQFHVNNNTTSQVNSPLSNASRLFVDNYTNTAGQPAKDVNSNSRPVPQPEGSIVYYINPYLLGNHVSLSEAFFVLRTDGTAPEMTITSILVEKYDGSEVQQPLPESVPLIGEPPLAWDSFYGSYVVTELVSGTIALTSAVNPSAAIQDITWTVTGGGTLNVYTGNNVTVTLPGYEARVEVTATSVKADVRSIVTIFVVTGSVPVYSISITGTERIMLPAPGEAPRTIQFTETVFPANAGNKAVNWVLKASDNFWDTTSVAAIASINTSTGLLTAVNEGVVWVFAEATDGSGIRSAGFMVTISGNANENIIYEWNAGSAITFIGNTPSNVVDVAGAPWYVNSENIHLGSINVTTAGIFLGGNYPMRLVIGTNSTVDSSASFAPGGVFNFSQGAKVTISYTGATWRDGNFQFSVNNNTGNEAISVLSNSSRLYVDGYENLIGQQIKNLNVNSIPSPSAAGDIIYYINPYLLGNHTSLSQAFFMIRTDGTAPTMTITSILIEKYDGSEVQRPSPTSVTLTGVPAFAGNPASGYTITGNAGSIIALTSTVTPVGASQNVTWTTTAGSLSSTTGSNVTVTLPSGSGQFTVTATAEGTGISSTVTIDVVTGDISVSSIAITNPVNSIMLAEPSSAPRTMQLTVNVLPAHAINRAVNWVLRASNNFGDSTVVTAATVDPAGLLTAVNEGVVWVFAEATDGSGIISAGFMVTIIPYDSEGYSRTVVFTFGPDTVGAGDLQIDWTAGNQLGAGGYTREGLTMNFAQVIQFRWAPSQSSGDYVGRIAATGLPARDPLAWLDVNGPFRVILYYAAPNTNPKTVHINVDRVSAADTGSFSTANNVVGILEYEYTGTNTVDLSFSSVGDNFYIYRVDIHLR